MKRSNLKEFFAAGAIGLTLISCSGDKGNTTSGDTTVTTTSTVSTDGSAAPAPATSVSFKDFDWTTVTESKAAFGAFPYITPPKDFMIVDKGASQESATGYSEMKEPYMLIMYHGTSFYNAEGKFAKLKFRMKDRDTDWNQYAFDKGVEKYLNAMGAVPIGTLELTSEQAASLNKSNDMTVYNHIIGDPYNEPIRMYALNTGSKKLMVQVYSNSAEGEIGVVEMD